MFENGLKDFYTGFWLDKPLGNNSFSYSIRQQKSIYVPNIVEGTLSDVCLGGHPVFCEVEDGKEICRSGLKHFVYWKNKDQHIFIFDNHNHAFYFWMYAYKNNFLQLNSTLVHVDQHKDTRQPDKNLDFQSANDLDLKKVFEYVNIELNVGNFIPPALHFGLFQSVEMVTNEIEFEKQFSANIVLDIDMDIFAPDMDYISKDLKMKKIRSYIKKAKLITVATSPFFIDQELAIALMGELFSDE